MCPRPLRIVLSRRPRNMNAKNPPTRRSPATPPPTINSVITVRRRLRKTLRNARSKNLIMACNLRECVAFNPAIGEADDARSVFEKTLIVRGEDKCQAECAIQVAHQLNQLGRVACVEVRSGLVRK